MARCLTYMRPQLLREIRPWRGPETDEGNKKEMGKKGNITGKL